MRAMRTLGLHLRALLSLRARPPALWPHALAGLWLLLGWVWLVRGAAHAGVPYRPWAFDHWAYSDLLAMGGDRYFHGGRPLPYLEDAIEYPPLLGLVIWGASFAPGGPAGYFTAGYVFLSAACLASVSLLGRIPGADPRWYAATPALVLLAGLNWDQLPIALLLAALLLHLRGGQAGAGAVAALGFSAKLLPAALLPAAAGALVGARRWGALAGAAAAFAAAVLAVNLLPALAAPQGLAWFWRYSAGRGAENSAWEALRHLPSLAHLVSDAAFLNRATALLIGAAAAVAFVGTARAAPSQRGRAVRLGLGLVLVAWVAVNKVWSPQYFLYVFAAAAVAAAPFVLFAPATLLSLVDYALAFEVRSSRGLIAWHGPVYLAEELFRTAFLLVLAGWMAAALLRLPRTEPMA